MDAFKSKGQVLLGQTLVFSGRLLSFSRRQVHALVQTMGAKVTDEVTTTTTMLVIGSLGQRTQEANYRFRRVEQFNIKLPRRIKIVSEDEFCELVGVLSPKKLRQQYHAQQDLLDRYKNLRADHLRYLQQWGLIQPAHRTPGENYYGFLDLSVIRQVDAELSRGTSFRAVLKKLLAVRSGQLTLNFHLEAQPVKIVKLPLREAPPLATLMNVAPKHETSSAEKYFVMASDLDNEDLANHDKVAAAYRAALAADPFLVPAIINLANIHYARDEMAEAQALYERAISLEPEVFEGYYNLGNIYHDLGHYARAQKYYREALRLNPSYADAYFYLAVTLEKNGQSQEALPQWRAYQRLAPNGEWVELAKEFSSSRD